MRACGATRAGAMRVLLVLVALASPVARSAGVAPAAARHGEAKPVLTTRYVLDPPRGAVAGAGPLKLTTGVVLESLSPPASQYELTSGADAALGSSVWRRALQRALGESFNAKIGAVTVNATVVTALGPDGALRMTNGLLAVHVSLSAPSSLDAPARAVAAAMRRAVSDGSLATALRDRARRSARARVAARVAESLGASSDARSARLRG